MAKTKKPIESDNTTAQDVNEKMLGVVATKEDKSTTLEMVGDDVVMDTESEEVKYYHRIGRIFENVSNLSFSNGKVIASSYDIRQNNVYINLIYIFGYGNMATTKASFTARLNRIVTNGDYQCTFTKVSLFEEFSPSDGEHIIEVEDQIPTTISHSIMNPIHLSLEAYILKNPNKELMLNLLGIPKN